MDAKISAFDLSSMTAAMTITESTHKGAAEPEFVRSGVFPFLKLPGELRNRVYEYLLTEPRGPRDSTEPVIFVNDLNRRSERREFQSVTPMSTGFSNKSRKLAKKHRILNDNEINTSRLKQRITGLPPLLDTNILRVCRQTYAEGSGIMWKMNTFAVAVPMVVHHLEGMELSSRFAGMDVTRIQHLRLELQLDIGFDIGMGIGLLLKKELKKTKKWTHFQSMRELKTLRIVATFCENNEERHKQFHRYWPALLAYQPGFQQLIDAVPFNVEIKAGLTRQEKVLGDYAGWCPVKACVLRKIVRWLKEPGDLYVSNWDSLETYPPINGDGEDSDEEADAED